ncbi:hypothetical protein Desti_4810 [Desulfomonile tiedjei DSM 6799]|uniref:Uncharacterized protein n=1 Tax=Desulfomonile tiedjei (strain ATCC 49306 / DSM 6799 / DCB-1) TaxID=706587 RepID=I4CCY5_DESTA|nr:hypothetical protein Desti_4810 [Desulfomonile tiedjei DSM 6799]
MSTLIVKPPGRIRSDGRSRQRPERMSPIYGRNVLTPYFSTYLTACSAVKLDLED